MKNRLALLRWQPRYHLPLLIGLQLFSLTLRADERSTVQIRRPVALTVVNEGRQLVTANQRSGSVSLIDLQTQKVVSETPVGKQLSDIATVGDPQRLLATDQETHQLNCVQLSPTGCRVEKTVPVSPYPVSVRVNQQGTQAFVASLWSKTISVVDLKKWISEERTESQQLVRQIRLPFSPRVQFVVEPDVQQRLIPIDKRKSAMLIVADAFGSKIAVIDPESATLESVRDFPGHAIREMRLHPTRPHLLMTHQMLSRRSQTTLDDVHWGNLMLNCLRSLDLRDLLNPKADLLQRSQLEFLGGPEKGAGDPAGFVFRPGSNVMSVVLSGTDEVAIDDGSRLFSDRVKTERFPTAMVLNPEGTRAYIANTLSDSISVLEIGSRSIVSTISLGPRPEETAADRGEQMFHSAGLSHDNWFSCASCHVDGHTNGMMNDNFTDESFGTAKRVLSLRGVAETAPYAWSGRFPTLADQIRHSAKSTMHGSGLNDQQVEELEQFLRTLKPAPALGGADEDSVKRGERLFEQFNCRNCHTEPTYTSSKTVEVNLADERGVSKFNPPSLRGVSHNGPYFHDGRATTLDSVFKEFHHQLERDLNAEELSDLCSFLKSL